MAPDSSESGLWSDTKLFIVALCQIAVGFGAAALLVAAPGSEISTTSFIMRLGAIVLIVVAVAAEAMWLMSDAVRQVSPVSLPRLGGTLFVVALALILLS